MAGHGKSKSKGRTDPLPPWAEVVPEGQRGWCSNDHSSQRVNRMKAMFRVLENTQGQRLAEPMSLCGGCLRRMETARKRHDEHAGSVRERNLHAARLAESLEVFKATTGVDLAQFATLAEGTFRLDEEDVQALAQALDTAYEGKTTERLAEAHAEVIELPSQAKPTGNVLTFARRVPTT